MMQKKSFEGWADCLISECFGIVIDVRKSIRNIRNVFILAASIDII